MSFDVGLREDLEAEGASEEWYEGQGAGKQVVKRGVGAEVGEHEGEVGEDKRREERK